MQGIARLAEKNENMKKIITAIFCLMFVSVACVESVDPTSESKGFGGILEGSINTSNLAEQNLLRAMQLADSATQHHFVGSTMSMARYYNPYTGSTKNVGGNDETGSVWMYTSAIEAVNAIMHGLKAQKDHGNADLYNKHFDRYSALLLKLYTNLDYYQGTFTLTSYTQTKAWSVYAVNRANAPGTANVGGILNVYDDQQWLIRELIDAYKLTNNSEYLTKAEYLSQYVLDGWDCVLDANGQEYGGIPWGPGYTTKHSCSNGPMVSPMVWLSELYKGKSDEITYKYIDTDKSRKMRTVKKSEYYLQFAQKIYNWQKTNLLRADGVYHDMLGGCVPNCDVASEAINGVTYRKHTDLRDKVGTAYSYNCGSMLSGAADLYRATGNADYLNDAKKLSDDSFNYFAKMGGVKPGYYSYAVTGFNNWFNGVLMRAFADVYPSHKDAGTALGTYQQNLDYAYNNYLYKGFLPTSLLLGWSRNTDSNAGEGMFAFTFAAEYAVLARYELEK